MSAVEFDPDKPMSPKLSRFVDGVCRYSRRGRVAFDPDWNVWEAREALVQLGMVGVTEDGAYVALRARVSPSKARRA